MLVDINIKLAAHDAKLEELLPQPASPPDVKETLAWAQKSPITPTAGKLYTANCTVLEEVTWPHKVMFTAEGKPAVCGELSVMAFVRGYLIVMDSQTQDIKTLMDSHLQNLMEDGEAYGLISTPPRCNT